MCDTVVVVGDDGVLFAKNSDRDANEGQGLEWHPAASHRDGAILSCTGIEIPQVARTHAVLLSRPFWMWGAEMGANEHGVVIGNEAVFTREAEADTGLLGMDLLRLALERADSAEAAVSVMVDLLERHGQGGGCGHEDRSFTYHNSFLVADRSRAVVLETAGSLWATEEVDTGARSISNGLTIPGFAEAHSDTLRTRVSACRHRRAITQGRAEHVSSPEELMTLLRDHGPGRSGPRYAWLNGAMAAPCMHGGGVVTNSQTTGSWVADLRGGGPALGHRDGRPLHRPVQARHRRPAPGPRPVPHRHRRRQPLVAPRAPAPPGDGQSRGALPPLHPRAGPHRAGLVGRSPGRGGRLRHRRRAAGAVDPPGDLRPGPGRPPPLDPSVLGQAQPAGRPDDLGTAA